MDPALFTCEVTHQNLVVRSRIYRHDQISQTYSNAEGAEFFPDLRCLLSRP